MSVYAICLYVCTCMCVCVYACVRVRACVCVCFERMSVRLFCSFPPFAPSCQDPCTFPPLSPSLFLSFFSFFLSLRVCMCVRPIPLSKKKKKNAGLELNVIGHLSLLPSCPLAFLAFFSFFSLFLSSPFYFFLLSFFFFFLLSPPPLSFSSLFFFAPFFWISQLGFCSPLLLNCTSYLNTSRQCLVSSSLSVSVPCVLLTALIHLCIRIHLHSFPSGGDPAFPPDPLLPSAFFSSSVVRPGLLYFFICLELPGTLLIFSSGHTHIRTNTHNHNNLRALFLSLFFLSLFTSLHNLQIPSAVCSCSLSFNLITPWI
ncbi:hypothetical protein BC939DRAFT_261805 [Gamsiella multidivaricata]|uniref:uncharacterized protein n=1 Tax=Gamsiella multidivaricata TaxID=101098 RepID=UPI00221E6BF2|nr:uncharacterized protein BC939DRAFT_261805 [Gamsiella multidivaricata]KAI7819480.1 hypothetical protein BC939DRAFT_261805 [Gamsiella multidivaricata]